MNMDGGGVEGGRGGEGLGGPSICPSAIRASLTLNADRAERRGWKESENELAVN